MPPFGCLVISIPALAECGQLHFLPQADRYRVEAESRLCRVASGGILLLFSATGSGHAAGFWRWPDSYRQCPIFTRFPLLKTHSKSKC